MIRSFDRGLRAIEVGWIVAAVALVLCFGGLVLAEAGESAEVDIDNFAFTPDALTVKPGVAVTFVNHDDIPHLVVAVDGKYRSKALDTNDRFSLVFDKPGEYAYFCGLHPHMKGKIVVAP
ncbi:MAG: cupredoxin family copper-binding protein [Roseiarcus sp.]|jgi:plastocyanin